MSNAIEVRNLTKAYKGINAVDNLSINVPEGKIYGFLGKNGAGKTTTIRMITRLIKPNSGEILVFGKDIRRNRQWAAANIGSIVESPGFYENLPARSNLEITATLYKTPKSRIGEVLEIVNLKDTGKKKVKDFSLGMKQRLGIANALVHSPKILILDEPTNGLDPSGIKDMRSFLKGLSRDKGITIMVSSHLLSEVQQIADYVGIIDKGRLVEETDISNIEAEDQSYLLLEVDKPEKAELVLKDMNIKFASEEKTIKAFCKKHMNSSINYNLVHKDINVFNLASVAKSLEERFLAITDEVNS
ncbi:ABC transporter ATP-binding protein [Pseudobacteroides cellulosolvens]|uniref:Sulfate-transporting ATPase n=1 Tax=Pseudobacteroides cellulosolvens ATCC 35603 = DSM 2933 TaxID=398512 RepID=A0A0L6JSD1_9FIRM|nr:ABC transporter ATP-binding protein [Pseudobacteroides cellulosolvens]KNY28322.1 Sulfate-transporting ATPase [Pseudobacteroides cellulosolvens ATCC 35603 = DSM 2933]